ncbi:hypothetical protein AGMMS4952_22480 [Spirochaetia bacterium]|nr:hypothetical protein AGMMS4952_22480 [Spirochaetia bacterium]
MKKKLVVTRILSTVLALCLALTGCGNTIYGDNSGNIGDNTGNSGDNTGNTGDNTGNSNNGNGDNGSNGNNENPAVIIPDVPGGLQAIALSPSEILVSWNAVAGADTYEVYDGLQSYTIGFPYKTIGGLKANTSYQFSVKAGNAAGWSGASAPVSGKTLAEGKDTTETLPGTLTGLKAEGLSSTEIRISWDTVSGANSYMVFYGTETAGSSQYGGATSDQTLTVTGLPPNTTYYFTVKAGNGAGWNGASSPVRGETQTVAVSGVILNNTDLSLTVGATGTLTATVAPSDATNKAVTWTTTNSAVATVSGGTVTGVAAGTAAITASTTDGGKTASTTVRVSELLPETVTVSGVTLNKLSLNLTVGASEALNAAIAPENATNKEVTWTTSDSTVATVSGGTVTAKATGTATITVSTTDGAKTANAAVTVTQPVSGISLNPESLSLTVGATGTLTATVAPSNATNKAVTWTTSNSAVATVSGGTVTGVAAGTATITASTTDGGKTASTTVRVSELLPETVTVSGVTLNKLSLNLTVGASETLNAAIAPENATNKEVTWTTSDSTIATVTDGVVSAVSAGTATITVSTTDGGKTASAKVTVPAPAPGTLEINIGFNFGAITITGSDGSNIIRRTGSPTSLTLSATGYTGVQWYVDGILKTGATGNSITLTAAAYTIRNHSVTFTGFKNGIPYSQFIPFAVVQ